jgi:hypothetical protein
MATPSPWQRHWGCASRKRTPWWASDTSPGIGMWAHADQPDIGDGVMGGAKGPGRDQGRPVAREAGDAVDARRLNGLGKGHRRQDDGQPPRQPRFPRYWAEQ